MMMSYLSVISIIRFCFFSIVNFKNVLSHFSCVQLFITLWTVVRQDLSPWNSLGKNAGVGCHALLQGIFLAQGSNLHLLGLLHWQADSLPLVPPGNPKEITLSGGGLVTKMCPTLATP